MLRLCKTIKNLLTDNTACGILIPSNEREANIMAIVMGIFGTVLVVGSGLAFFYALLTRKG